MTAWLLTIEQEQGRLEPGQRFRLWTQPPRHAATGLVRRRADGEPHTPSWTDGDEVVLYRPATGRVFAILRAEGDPWWDNGDELLYLDTVVETFDFRGPTLAEIGVEQAVQGGRQRLTPVQHGAARRRLEHVPAMNGRQPSGRCFHDGLAGSSPRKS